MYKEFYEEMRLQLQKRVDTVSNIDKKARELMIASGIMPIAAIFAII